MNQTIIYNPRCETLSRDELEQLQIERLQSALNRAYRNVAFYRTAFDRNKVNLEKIKQIRDLRALPFTTRKDLQNSYPYDLFAVPLRDIVRIHSAPSSADKPVVAGYTRNDLKNWTECVARQLAAVGVTEHDVVQIALDYHLFAGAFGFHQGAEQIGASVIPSSLTANVEKQILIIKDYKTTVLITTPSHGANLAAALEKLQIHPERLQWRLGIFGGERWSDAFRRRLEQQLQIDTTDTYGLSEVMGPGVAGECYVRQGLHVNEDHFIVEVIDPRRLEPVEPGEEGELVVTTITREGIPLIRYRTGDITSLDRQPCPCGRTFLRMAGVKGRTDDLILFRGLSFFPAQIEAILAGQVGASPHYQIILDRQDGADTLEIRLEVPKNLPFLDEIKTLENLQMQLSQNLKVALEAEIKITFVEPRSLQNIMEGAGRVIDKRLGE